MGARSDPAEAGSIGERLKRSRQRTEAEVRRVLRDTPKALTAPEGLRSRLVTRCFGGSGTP